MEFLHASIALLASMVLVLAAMVGWLYWQQTRLFQNMNSIVMIVGELARAQAYAEAPITVEETTVEPTSAPQPVPQPEEEEDDDRVSVEPEIIEGPPGPIDTDGLEGKSIKELKDMLTKRGIPFGKRDSKNILISLLKATA